MRVPHADGTLVKVPASGFSDETLASLLALTDVMANGFHAAVSAGAIVGRVGAPHGVDIDAVGTFYRNIGLRGGPTPARHYQPALLEQALDGSINPERRAIKALVKVSELA